MFAVNRFAPVDAADGSARSDILAQLNRKAAEGAKKAERAAAQAAEAEAAAAATRAAEKKARKVKAAADQEARDAAKEAKTAKKAAKKAAKKSKKGAVVLTEDAEGGRRKRQRGGGDDEGDDDGEEEEEEEDDDEEEEEDGLGSSLAALAAALNPGAALPRASKAKKGDEGRPDEDALEGAPEQTKHERGLARARTAWQEKQSRHNIVRAEGDARGGQRGVQGGVQGGVDGTDGGGGGGGDDRRAGWLTLEEEATSWDLDADVVKVLRREGFNHFLPIQRRAIPAIIRTRHQCGTYGPDVCVSAPTGSGKTLVYVIAVIQTLLKRVVPRLRALVVVPTRDLVQQVKMVFDQ